MFFCVVFLLRSSSSVRPSVRSIVLTIHRHDRHASMINQHVENNRTILNLSFSSFSIHWVAMAKLVRCDCSNILERHSEGDSRSFEWNATLTLVFSSHLITTKKNKEKNTFHTWVVRIDYHRVRFSSFSSVPRLNHWISPRKKETRRSSAGNGRQEKTHQKLVSAELSPIWSVCVSLRLPIATATTRHRIEHHE